MDWKEIYWKEIVNVPLVFYNLRISLAFAIFLFAVKIKNPFHTLDDMSSHATESKLKNIKSLMTYIL